MRRTYSGFENLDHAVFLPTYLVGVESGRKLCCKGLPGIPTVISTVPTKKTPTALPTAFWITRIMSLQQLAPHPQ
jgi:hypothetical protein